MKQRARTLHHKVSSAFILFFTFFTLCFVLLIRYGYQQQLSVQYLQQSEYENALIATQLDNLLDTTQSNGNNIIVTINNLVDLSDDAVLVTRLSKIRTVFTTNLIAQESIAQTMVVFSQGDLHLKSSSGSYTYSAGNTALVAYLDALDITTAGCYFYIANQGVDVLADGIYYAKQLCEIDTLTPLGYVVLKLDEGDLYDIYAEQADSATMTYYLLDPQGSIVSSDDEDAFAAQDDTSSDADYLAQVLAEHADYTVQTTALSQGWTLVSLYDLAADLQNDLGSLYTFLLLVLVVLLVLYRVIVNISRHLTDPLAELTNHMNNRTPALPEQIESKSDSIEIESLTASFNLMVEHYHTLFKQMQAEQEAKAMLEMQLLQTQIKPHFLYNTLGTAHCLNVVGNTGQADNLIKALVAYYRIVLSNGADWIPLEKEFDSITHYLEIMSVRYASFLSYEINLPPALAEYIVPKLTLQPLIENAIDHGVKPARQKAKISVWAEEDDAFIYLHVRDYGAGLSEEQFLAYIKGEKLNPDGGFGLKNVADRVNGYYKGRGKLTLNPVEIGTDVVVHIPKNKE